jgi:hypothetical protein
LVEDAQSEWCAYPDDRRLDVGAVIRVRNWERLLSQELTSVQLTVHANDTHRRLRATLHDLAFNRSCSTIPGQRGGVQVNGSDSRRIQESLGKEPSIGKQEQDVDGIVDQSLSQNLSKCLCAIEHGDGMGLRPRLYGVGQELASADARLL